MLFFGHQLALDGVAVVESHRDHNEKQENKEKSKKLTQFLMQEVEFVSPLIILFFHQVSQIENLLIFE